MTVGDIELVSQLLAAGPDLTQVDPNTHKTAFELSIALDHEKIAELLIATCPTVIGNSMNMHLAAVTGKAKVLELLLAASPTSIHSVLHDGGVALRLKQSVDRESLTHLFKKSPTLAKFIATERTALEVAALKGYGRVVELLLAASPPSEVNHHSASALFSAVRGGAEAIAQSLLASNPELASNAIFDREGNTLLHICIRGSASSDEFLEKLWKMNPNAVTVVNHARQTPFHVAVELGNDFAIELFQWSLTADEICQAYESHERFAARFRPVIVKQCEPLLEVLNQDVANLVFDYVCHIPPSSLFRVESLSFTLRRTQRDSESKEREHSQKGRKE